MGLRCRVLLSCCLEIVCGLRAGGSREESLLDPWEITQRTPERASLRSVSSLPPVTPIFDDHGNRVTISSHQVER